MSCLYENWFKPKTVPEWLREESSNKESNFFSQMFFNDLPIQMPFPFKSQEYSSNLKALSPPISLDGFSRLAFICMSID